MKYQDFAAEVACLANCSQREVKGILGVMTETVPRALQQDGRLQIPGLGVFTLRERAERMARNPRTGEPVVIPARREVAFKPAAGLKEAVNAACAVEKEGR